MEGGKGDDRKRTFTADDGISEGADGLMEGERVEEESSKPYILASIDPLGPQRMGLSAVEHNLKVKHPKGGFFDKLKKFEHAHPAKQHAVRDAKRKLKHQINKAKKQASKAKS